MSDLDIIQLDGTVIPSAQLEYSDFTVDQYMPLLYGIIISVQPADDKDNFTSLQKDDRRGHRHECTVLVSDTVGKQPDLIVKHVIIPPERPSGLDNFEEDLPRGCSGTVDGSLYNDEFQEVNFSKLDGEWCVVAFIGGKLQDPFILRWWPHPANVYAPASSGFGHPRGKAEVPGEALKQVDLDRNRSRAVRRINGSVFLVNKEGSFYLDTTESNSKAEIQDGKLKRTKIDKGGHVQIDICKDAQMEFNWNEKDTSDSGKPRIGAGSNSGTQQHDLDLPHEKQPVKGVPSVRATNRTFIRAKEFEALLKTSQLNIFCEDQSSETSGNKGECTILAQDQVVVSQQPNGGSAATFTMNNGEIKAVGVDGSNVSILPDQVSMATKSKASLALKGAAVDIRAPAGVTVSAPLTVGPGVSPAVLYTGLAAGFDTYVAAVAAAETARANAYAAAPAAPPDARALAIAEANAAYLLTVSAAVAALGVSIALAPGAPGSLASAQVAIS